MQIVQLPVVLARYPVPGYTGILSPDKIVPGVSTCTRHSPINTDNSVDRTVSVSVRSTLTV
eukprot:3093465-Rhodomonas_salina.1